jgi:2-oxoisovalerate dehydrogenase E1 component subunit beta
MTALLAPVERVTGYDVVMPLPRLEREYMPSVARILKACERTLAWR